eukprot:3970950-Alexandrium_andersonii.AAC.1
MALGRRTWKHTHSSLCDQAASPCSSPESRATKHTAHAQTQHVGTCSSGCPNAHEPTGTGTYANRFGQQDDGANLHLTCP